MVTTNITHSNLSFRPLQSMASHPLNCVGLGLLTLVAALLFLLVRVVRGSPSEARAAEGNHDKKKPRELEAFELNAWMLGTQRAYLEHVHSVARARQAISKPLIGVDHLVYIRNGRLFVYDFSRGTSIALSEEMKTSGSSFTYAFGFESLSRERAMVIACARRHDGLE